MSNMREIGKQNGPVWNYSGSLEKYLANLANNTVVRGGSSSWNGTRHTNFISPSKSKAKRADPYWLATLGPKGSVSTTSRCKLLNTTDLILVASNR